MDTILEESVEGELERNGTNVLSPELIHTDSYNTSHVTETCAKLLNNTDIACDATDVADKDLNHTDTSNDATDNRKKLVSHTDESRELCDNCLIQTDLYDMAEATDNNDAHSTTLERSAVTPFLCTGDGDSNNSNNSVEINDSRQALRDTSSSNSVSSSECEEIHADINQRLADNSRECYEDEYTIASRSDLHRNSCMTSRTAEHRNNTRKESFEQKLRRTFTIKDVHTSEVTRRVLAIVIKYALFIFNFVSWITAVAAIGLGIWMRTDKTLLVTSDTEFYLDLPLLMCIGGGVTFIVAFLGCVGALRENLILLKVFFYVLAFILIGEMILATAVFILYAVPEARDNFLRSQPEKILYSAIQRYMDDPEVKEWVDRIQSEFKCCGISHTDEGFRDWQNSPYFNCTTLNRSIYRCAVPTSCCIFEKGDRVNIMCGFEITDKPLSDVRDYIYTRGCIIGFGEWLGKYNNFIIISCLSIIIMQFFAVLSAKVMVVRIRKQRSRWRVLQSNSSSSANTVTRSA